MAPSTLLFTLLLGVSQVHGFLPLGQAKPGVSITISKAPVQAPAAPVQVAPVQVAPVQTAPVQFHRARTQSYQPFHDFIQFKRNAFASLLGTLIRRAGSLCRPKSCGSLRPPSQRHCCRSQGTCCPLRPIVVKPPVPVAVAPAPQPAPQFVRPLPEHPAVPRPCTDHVQPEHHVAAPVVDDPEPSHPRY